MHITWQPHTEHGKLSTAQQNDLPESVFAFPKQRKEPLTDAAHVKNALARFDQVKGVSDADRELAFANIKKAAEHAKQAQDHCSKAQDHGKQAVAA